VESLFVRSELHPHAVRATPCLSLVYMHQPLFGPSLRLTGPRRNDEVDVTYHAKTHDEQSDQCLDASRPKYLLSHPMTGNQKAFGAHFTIGFLTPHTINDSTGSLFRNVQLASYLALALAS
jgi:hypothetical protein